VVGYILNGGPADVPQTQQASVKSSRLKFTTSKTLVEIKIGNKIYKRDHGTGFRYTDNNDVLYIPFYEFIKIIDIYSNGYKTTKNDGSISSYYAGTIFNKNDMAIYSIQPELLNFVEVKLIQSDNPRVASKKQYTIYSKDKTRSVIHDDSGHIINGQTGFLPVIEYLQALGISYEHDEKNDVLLLILK
jgi:hypothetical protein